MKKTLLIGSFFLSQFLSYSQLTVDTLQTPEQIVEDVFLANGIFVSNVTYNGSAGTTASGAVGAFGAVGTNLGIDGGILLTSGSAMGAIGTNASTASSSYNAVGVVNEPDLNAIVDYSGTYDGAIIEFDFIATGDSLDFVYIFGSEEYEEFVGSSFNDVFGFFISGPGISGTYSNNAVNIALIPGTTNPVSINNVNAGMNASYFVLNNGQIAVEYDGLTVPLHASIGGLSVGDIYHIKLAITDVADGALDSGVFLSGSSFVQFCTDDGPRDGACMLSAIQAHVEYSEICGEVFLTNESVLNIETTGCYYEMGDGNTLSSCDGPATYTYASPGTYTLKLVYQVNSFKSKFTIGDLLISATAPEQPVVQTTATNSNVLEITNWDGMSGLQWYLNDQPIDGATESTFVFTEDGAYYVVANNGCPSTSATINAVLININDLNLNSNSLSVYPNPSSGAFNVQIHDATGRIEITDAIGKIVFSESVQGGKIITVALSSGYYMLKQVDYSGQVINTCKAIVR